MVRAHDDLASLCAALIDLANERGGPDNITVVAARFDGDGLPQAGEAEGVGYSVYHPAEGESDEDDAPAAAAVADAVAPAPLLLGSRARAWLLMAAVLCLIAALLALWL